MTITRRPWDDVIPEADRRQFQRYHADSAAAPRWGRSPAVVVVDMTYKFVSSDYPTGFSETGWPAVDANVELLDAARAAGLPIYFSKGYSGELGPPTPGQIGLWPTRGTKHPGSHALDGDEVVEQLRPRPSEVVLNKGGRPSAFFGTDLVSQLIFQQVDTVIVTGMTTSGCVRATVLDAFQYNFRVVVPFECVADRSQISHKVSLFDIHMKYGDVVPLSTVAEFLASGR